jgi:hypothetical protein
MTAGRPKFKIEYEQVKLLTDIHCTQEEIAAALGCSVDTLQRDEKFCGIYKAGLEDARKSLRRRQWEAADKGNTTMLVWLGKQYLKQKDKSETQHSGNVKIIATSEDEDI